MVERAHLKKLSFEKEKKGISVQSDCCTSHQVLDSLGEHLYHRDVTNTSQGHGRRREDKISSQDRLEERKEMTLILMGGGKKKKSPEPTLFLLPFFHPKFH